MNVLLVSTLTLDRIPAGSHGEYREIPGGPGHYIGQALSRLAVDYRLITGERTMVEVTRTGAGQEYTIPRLPLIPLPARLSASAVILSPIGREIDPHRVPPVDGLLAIDVQGFVREPLRPTGHATGPYNLAPLIRRADIVKASLDELRRLDAETLDALAGCTLVRTDGQHGSYLTSSGEETFIPARAVHDRHTIGAGDTFLAALVVAVLNGSTLVEAATTAARFTESILQRRAAEN